jgi:beta-phosphoglucomutase
MPPKLQAALFDLDGVIVDTAKYHYLAWKSIADEEKIEFNPEINERLKGVSRMASLDVILEKGHRSYSPEEKLALAEKKNNTYVEMIRHLKPDEILPGIPALLDALRASGIRSAICSASKNADMILERLGLKPRFDTIVGGNDVSKSKPDPEVFVVAAQRLKVPNDACLVFEDAQAGIQAAKSAGMKAVGIGQASQLVGADLVVSGTALLNLDAIIGRLFAATV